MPRNEERESIEGKIELIRRGDFRQNAIYVFKKII
jgi:hypothetical protein